MLAALEFQDYAVIGVLMFLVTSGTAIARSGPSKSAQHRRLEAKLDAILTHFGITIPESISGGELSQAVRDLANQGRKIEAIKVYREETGVGLKEAKDAVEAYLGQ